MDRVLIDTRTVAPDVEIALVLWHRYGGKVEYSTHQVLTCKRDETDFDLVSGNYFSDFLAAVADYKTRAEID